MSHTPGPWHWDSDPMKGDPLGRVRYRVTTLGKTITQLYYGLDDEHAEADARLISAAPDLLAALEAVLAEEMIYTGSISETLEDAGFHCELVDKIKAAIAKAKS